MTARIQPKAGPLDAQWPVRAYVDKVAEWLLHLDATEVEHAIGAEYVQQSGKPPRYVWVPTEDDFKDSTDKVATNPKALRTEWVGVDVYVWGSTYAQAYALRNSLIRACYKFAVGAFQLRGGSWRAAPANQASPGARLEPTKEYVLKMAFLAPIVDATVDIVAAGEVAFTHDGQITGENGPDVPPTNDNDC